MCVHVCVGGRVCAYDCSGSWSPEEGTGSPGAEVTDGWEILDVSGSGLPPILSKSSVSS